MTGRLSSSGGVGSGLSETVLVAFEDAGDAELIARGGAPEVEDQVEDPDVFMREWDALVGGDYSDEMVRALEPARDPPSPDDSSPALFSEEVGASRLDVDEAKMIGDMMGCPLLLLLSGTREATFYRL
jgi:hypothetical protein